MSADESVETAESLQYPDGTYRQKICQACGKRRSANLFIAELCEDCFTTGVSYPDEARP